jgi:hypothetical protein
LPGLTSCNGKSVDAQSERQHCGACNTFCPYVCHAGSCLDTDCAAPEVECHGGCHDPSTFDTDPMNCGNCGHECSANQACVSGVCRAFLVAPGCAQCPCAACGSKHTCCPAPYGGSGAVCVLGAACP